MAPNPPSSPVENVATAAGFPDQTPQSSGLEPTSMAFFNAAGTERLYSGVTNSSASTARTSARKRAHAAGGSGSSSSVDAILDGAVKVLKRGGGARLTTNHIAAAAGVSIGSLYQYFPDKRAIFVALHDRHVDGVSRRIDETLATNAGAPVTVLLRAVLQALIDAHAKDPELYALLDAELPQGGAAARTLHRRLRAALRPALAGRSGHQPEATLFVVTHMLDALAHGAILNRPPGLSWRAARDASLAAILRYVRA